MEEGNVRNVEVYSVCLPLGVIDMYDVTETPMRSSTTSKNYNHIRYCVAKDEHIFTDV